MFELLVDAWRVHTHRKRWVFVANEWRDTFVIMYRTMAAAGWLVLSVGLWFIHPAATLLAVPIMFESARRRLWRVRSMHAAQRGDSFNKAAQLLTSAWNASAFAHNFGAECTGEHFFKLVNAYMETAREMGETTPKSEALFETLQLLRPEPGDPLLTEPVPADFLERAKSIMLEGAQERVMEAAQVLIEVEGVTMGIQVDNERVELDPNNSVRDSVFGAIASHNAREILKGSDIDAEFEALVNEWEDDDDAKEA